MKLARLLRPLVEWLALGCFLLWCLFSFLALVGTPRLPSSLAQSGPAFALWFAASWWAWAALIWSESMGGDAPAYPRWVKAGLVAGVACVLIAFWVGAPRQVFTGSLGLRELAAAALLLLLFGLAPLLLATDHLRRIAHRL
jgi:hypothetical protein